MLDKGTHLGRCVSFTTQVFVELRQLQLDLRIARIFRLHGSETIASFSSRVGHERLGAEEFDPGVKCRLNERCLLVNRRFVLPVVVCLGSPMRIEDRYYEEDGK